MKIQRIWNSLVSGINSLKKSVSALGPYKDVITVVSALVVVASFVVKDAWGEHLKQLVDATQTAESRFESDSRWLEEQDLFSRLISQNMRPGVNAASDSWTLIYNSYSDVHLRLFYTDRLCKSISVRKLSDRLKQLKAEQTEADEHIRQLQKDKKSEYLIQIHGNCR